MRIGILTFHRSDNYGAFLQAYSLTMAIRKRFPNWDVELIDYDSKKAQKYYYKLILKEGRKYGLMYYVKRHIAFSKAVKQLPLSRKKCITDNLSVVRDYLKGQYDIIVAGSDQIWKLDSFRGFPNAYWLPDEYGCEKLSYAASSRSIFSTAPERTVNTVKSILSGYQYIGVRDDITFRELKNVLSYGVIRNCDPSFLYDFCIAKDSARDKLASLYHIDNHLPIVGVMSKDENVIKRLRNKYGNSINIVSIDIPHSETKANPNISPFEFAEIIAGLDVLITSFFHGLCFAIKGNTPFVALDEKKSESEEQSKILDLLKLIHKEQYYFRTDGSDYVHNVVGIVDYYLANEIQTDNDDVIRKLMDLSETFFEKLQEIGEEYEEKIKKNL